MNKSQQHFADAHPALGNLLVQIDTFYQTLPEAVKKSFDRLGEAPVPHGCHVDLGPGEKPDSCVMDSKQFDDCVHAERLHSCGKDKTACEHWRPIKLSL